MTTQPTDKQYRGAKHGLSTYPVGSTWQYRTDQGRLGTIELKKRGEYLEQWVWSVFNSDGTVAKSDWAPCYRLCRIEIPLWNTGKKPVRFMRIR